jgi:hypothetical protein
MQFFQRFEKNSTLKRLVEVRNSVEIGSLPNLSPQYAFVFLTKPEDAQTMEDFFKDKDVSRFQMALGQTLETIRSKATYIEVSHELL